METKDARKPKMPVPITDREIDVLAAFLRAEFQAILKDENVINQSDENCSKQTEEGTK